MSGHHLNYSNGQGPYNKFFSCFSCSVGIPVAALVTDLTSTSNLGKITSMRAFDFDNVGISYDTGGTIVAPGEATTCIDIDTKVTGGILPTNCGLAILNVASDKDAADADISNFANDKIAAFCVACLPGYEPTLIATNTNNDNLTHIVTSCSLIANCTVDNLGVNTDIILNECLDCLYEVDSNTEEIDYYTCLV